MLQIPFQVTDWDLVAVTRHPGETGEAVWKTLSFQDLRIRVVEYSPHYKADHWCSKGHLIFCLEGEMITELLDGSTFVLSPGMSYQVTDEMSLHRSISVQGVKLLIIDGGFLKREKGVLM